ncbi:MAG: hypothetical protein HKN70_03280 [Gammaproteobacteria bacterium]|nr:hypothetical protein [Gammaproteobacteria bacterium]
MTRPLIATLSLDELPRFVEALEFEQKDSTTVDCRLEPRKVDANTVEMTGSVRTTVQVCCQRCLETLALDLQALVQWSFTSDDTGDGAGNDTGNDTGTNGTGAGIDLLSWVEDELLLSLPQYPTHVQATCGGDSMKKYMSESVTDDKESVTPFADLKKLLSEKKPS